MKDKTINFINLYVENELDYLNNDYLYANQSLQYLDDKKYIATFYYDETDINN